MNRDSNRQLSLTYKAGQRRSSHNLISDGPQQSRVVRL